MDNVQKHNICIHVQSSQLLDHTKDQKLSMQTDMLIFILTLKMEAVYNTEMSATPLTPIQCSNTTRFNPEDGGSMRLRNAGNIIHNDTTRQIKNRIVMIN
jgi:hypothetical protein